MSGNTAEQKNIFSMVLKLKNKCVKNYKVDIFIKNKKAYT